MKQAMKQAPKQVTLDLTRILQSQGFGSRRQCRALIEAGEVKVDGRICDDPARLFAVGGLGRNSGTGGPGGGGGTDGAGGPGGADGGQASGALSLCVAGETWLYREHVYLALNKPAGYECSQQPQHHPSVFSLLPAPLRARGTQCVGRLDHDTTGLLLLSDDGAFIHALASPRRHVAKTYHATLRYPAQPELLDALRAGVLLHGEREPSRVLSAAVLDAMRVELVIDEGKYHQVKRMVAAAGNRVEALHRQAVGNLALADDLAPGAWNWLGDEVVAKWMERD